MITAQDSMSWPTPEAATAAPLLAGAHPVGARWGEMAPGAGGGSYTSVFIVLGVIAALLVISCLVGQVCTKKHLRPRPRRDRVAYYDDDMEGGFPRAHRPRGGGAPGIAKTEAAAAPPATTVEAPPPADGAVAVQQSAACMIRQP